jgi:hypothetical protein
MKKVSFEYNHQTGKRSHEIKRSDRGKHNHNQVHFYKFTLPYVVSLSIIVTSALKET